MPRPRWLRPLLAVYALVVAALATVGFTHGSAAGFLLAAFLTLPSSVVAVPAYYMLFGLLAQLPGANPSQSTGSGFCTSNGDCHVSTTGDAAAWFTHATDLVGIVALTAAALVNSVLVEHLLAARRVQSRAPAQPDTE